MATSFKKKSSRGRVLQIPGTRPSIHNNQLLVSTGIPSLDSVIGGGIAVGTVLLVEEDIYGSYARQLLKYFLAEGIVSGHSLFLASAELEPSAILKDLPYPMNEEDDSEPGLSTPGRQEESMKIAWRYQQLPKVQSSLACSNFSHYFDLTRVMKEPRVHRLPITTFDATSEWSEGIQCGRSMDRNPLYEKLISSLKQTICQGGYSTTHKQQQQKSILRLALHGLGSQLWGEACSATDFTTGLPRFLYCLRAQLRSSFAVCMVTMPTHVFQDSGFTKRIEHLADTVVSLESFAGSNKETNPVYKNYHGLFHIIRLPRLNSLMSHMPSTLDLAFKLRRKKLTIEMLHLPPDLSINANREQEDPVSQSGSCQAGTGNSRLDF